MKRLIFIGVCVLLAGCESVPTAPNVSPEVMQKRFLTTSQLHTGLSRAEVAAILGKEVVVGYALADQVVEQYQPITSPNLKRSETIKKNNKNYMVDYYLAGIKVADDKISDDELLPLVFENDHLIGIGWDYLNQHIKGQ